MSIDYSVNVLYFGWKAIQTSSMITYDLLFPEIWADFIDDGWLEEALMSSGKEQLQRHSWTDVLVVCDENIVAGGFWTSSDSWGSIRADSHFCVNYRPLKRWSEQELECAQNRATLLEADMPWHESICADESGRRFKCAATLNGVPPTQLN